MITVFGTVHGFSWTVLACRDGTAGPYKVFDHLASTTVMGRLGKKASAVMASSADCAGLRIVCVLTALAAFAPLTSQGLNNFSFAAMVCV